MEKLNPRKESGETLGRTKAARNCAIRPWLSARMDCREGRFLQLGNSFFFSEEVQKLSPGARWLYLCFAIESGGQSTVKFTHGCARKYGVAGSSFDRYIKELIGAGFVSRDEDGNYLQFSPAVFRFELGWKSKPPPHSGEGTP